MSTPGPLASQHQDPPVAGRKGGRRGTLLAIANTIGSRLGWVAISAATGMVTARALGPAGRGALAAMIMWPVFLAGVLTFGLPSALIFCIRRSSQKERASLFTTATLLGLAIGIVASAVATLIVPFWLKAYGVQVVHWTQWLLVFTIVSMLMLIFRAALEATDKFGTSASTWLLVPVQILAGLLALVSLGKLTELRAALCYVLAGVPVVVWMFLRLRRELGWSLAKFRRSAHDLLSYGLRSYGVDLCGTLAQSVDQALVVGMISASDMGRYVVALSFSRILNSVFQAASAVLFPKCIGLTPRQSLILTVRFLAAGTAVALPGAAIVWIFGAPLLRLLYGPEYALATLLLKLLTAEALLSGISTVLAQPYMAAGKPGTVTVLQAASLLATIPLLFALVPRYGTVGAGAALLSASVLRLLLVIGLYLRSSRGLPSASDLRSLLNDLLAGLTPSMEPSGTPAAEPQP